MLDKKRILVVDDHFEMLEFLRSMLEMSNPGYRVLAAPSAEEGLLELRRTASRSKAQRRDSSGEQLIDLLITDVRLPGMSGFDLVRKVRDFRPELPVMMITAYVSAQGKEEAHSLGVYRYFEKPLDTDALLAAVHAALTTDGAEDTAPAPANDLQRADDSTSLAAFAKGPSPNGAVQRRQLQAPEDRVSTAPATKNKTTVEDEITARLETLLSDTGAVQTLLADEKGTILFRAGKAPGVAVERLARLQARSLANSFELAAELQSTEPFTIQYQAGERADLYTANIGRHYFLALLFDAQARRGRIGTVWVFAQRAIKTLRTLLPLRDDRVVGQGAAEVTAQGAPDRSEASAGDAPTEIGEKAAEQPEQTSRTGEQPAVQRTAQAAEKANGAVAQDSVDYEVAELFELMDVDDLPETDLDAFWEEAAAGAGKVDGDGLSFEEAIERGLLPPELQQGLDL